MPYHSKNKAYMVMYIDYVHKNCKKQSIHGMYNDYIHKNCKKQSIHGMYNDSIHKNCSLEIIISKCSSWLLKLEFKSKNQILKEIVFFKYKWEKFSFIHVVAIW